MHRFSPCRTMLFVAVASVLASDASAQVIGPTYPAPGGNTFAGNGSSPSSATGAVGRYSGLNSASFDDLYWTYTAVANPYWAPTGPRGAMTFSAYNGSTGVSTWTSTQNLTFTDVFGISHSTATVFSMQLQPYSLGVNAQMGSGWLTPITLAAAGITPGPDQSSMQSVFSDALGSDFQVWSRYTTADGTPLASYYNSFNHNGDNFSTSASGAFYYTEEIGVTATPEPASLTLLASGLAGVFGAARRRRRTTRVGAIG
jgi:hypothetical protein